MMSRCLAVGEMSPMRREFLLVLVFMKGEKSDREDDSDKYGWVDKAILKFIRCLHQRVF